MRNFAAELKQVASKEKLVDIHRDNTFKRTFLKSSKKAWYKQNRQSAYYQAFALSLTFEILSKILIGGDLHFCLLFGEINIPTYTM